jgi:hypothetical protein
MLYEFIGKIKDINKAELLHEDAFEDCLADICHKLGKTMDIRILSDQQPMKDALIKAQVSISSFAALHDQELNVAIRLFKDFLEEIAETFDGEISRTEGFYHNSSSFNKLWG